VFLLDDILLAQIKGVLWIFEEIVNAAEEDLAAESDRIKDRLREMYMQLETGQISEEAFDAEESLLLDRLDELEPRGAEAPADEDASNTEEDAEEARADDDDQDE
jgi:hypothetical protein